MQVNAFRNILVAKWLKIGSIFGVKPIRNAFTTRDVKEFCDNITLTVVPRSYVTLQKSEKVDVDSYFNTARFSDGCSLKYINQPTAAGVVPSTSSWLC